MPDFSIEVIAAIQGIIMAALGWGILEIIKIKVAVTKHSVCNERIEALLIDLKSRFDASHVTKEK